MPTGINVCDIDVGYAQFAFNQLLGGMRDGASVGFDADLFDALLEIDFDFKILRAGTIHEQLVSFFGSLELDSAALDAFKGSYGFTNFVVAMELAKRFENSFIKFELESFFGFGNLLSGLISLDADLGFDSISASFTLDGMKGFFPFHLWSRLEISLGSVRVTSLQIANDSLV